MCANLYYIFNATIVATSYQLLTRSEIRASTKLSLVFVPLDFTPSILSMAGCLLRAGNTNRGATSSFTAGHFG